MLEGVQPEVKPLESKKLVLPQESEDSPTKNSSTLAPIKEIGLSKVILIALAIGLLMFGIYKSRLYKQLLYETNPDTYYEIGVSYLLKEKYYLAGANFHKYLAGVKDIKTIDNKKRFIIGATFAETGRYYQAIQLLENTLPDESDRIFYKADYYNLLAESYLNKSKYDLVLENTDKALAIQNAGSAAIRRAHRIKYLAFDNKGETGKAKEEAKALGNLSSEDLDIFELEFYASKVLDDAYEEGILEQITNKSYDAISQSQKLSPITKAVIFTSWATNYRKNGDFTKAEFYAKKAVEIDPDYLFGFYELGHIYSAQGKFHTALGYDQKAAKIDPDHPLVRTAIGWDYYNLATTQSGGKGGIIEVMKLAEENYLKALETDPELAIAQNNLGLVFFERNQCDKASERFNLSIKYDPTYQKPVNNLGAVYYEFQDYEKAVEYFEKSLKIKPDYSRAYLNIGRAYLYKGDFQRSLSALKKTLELDPYDTDAYLWIANNYLAQGQNRAAIDTLNKAIAITSDYPKLYFALSDAYYESGDTQKGKESFEKAMSFFLMADTVGSAEGGETYASSEYIYHFNRGVEYKKNGEMDKAIEAFEKAIELQPGYTDSYIPLSRIYESKYGKDKSVELLQKGLKAAPESLQLYDELGYIYKDNGDLDSALKVFQEAVSKVQGHCDKVGVARIFEGLGLVYYDQKKFDLALDAFNKGLEQNPRSATIYTNLGATYTAKGDNQKAMGVLRTAIQINPKEALAHNNLGDILAQQGKISEAIMEFRNALEIDPSLKIAQENLDRYQNK